LDEQANVETPTPPEEKSHNIKREFVELLKLVVVFLVVFWGIKTFVIEGYEVLGDSMVPTLQDRERILVLKLPHTLSKLDVFGWLHPFKQGDIIVFEGVERKRYVKRVIALNPSRRRGEVEAQQLTGSGNSTTDVKVEFDRGAVRINNWQIDETAYLPERARQTNGHDLCVLRPGEYYVLGDNRPVSKDSRSFKAVPDEQIVGRAILRFWPLSRATLF
jgi:signal peptidase I